MPCQPGSILSVESDFVCGCSHPFRVGHLRVCISRSRLLWCSSVRGWVGGTCGAAHSFGCPMSHPLVHLFTLTAVKRWTVPGILMASHLTCLQGNHLFCLRAFSEALGTVCVCELIPAVHRCECPCRQPSTTGGWESGNKYFCLLFSVGTVLRYILHSCPEEPQWKWAPGFPVSLSPLLQFCFLGIASQINYMCPELTIHVVFYIFDNVALSPCWLRRDCLYQGWSVLRHSKWALESMPFISKATNPEPVLWTNSSIWLSNTRGQ